MSLFDLNKFHDSTVLRTMSINCANRHFCNNVIELEIRIEPSFVISLAYETLSQSGVVRTYLFTIYEFVTEVYTIMNELQYLHSLLNTINNE